MTALQEAQFQFALLRLSVCLSVCLCVCHALGYGPEVPWCTSSAELRNLTRMTYEHVPGGERVRTWCDFPNPRTDWTACGRPYKTWLCDPDGLLSDEDARQLESLLNHTVSTSLCRCRKGCHQGQGHPLAIAVMRHASIADTSGQICLHDRTCEDVFPKLNTSARKPEPEEVRRAMDSWARQLLRQWDLGKCGDEVVLVYTQDFHGVGGIAGYKAVDVLGETFEGAMREAQPYLNDNDLRRGFSILIHQYGVRLRSRKLWPFVVGILCASVVGALVVFGFTMTICYCRTEFKAGKDCGQIWAGTFCDYWYHIIRGLYGRATKRREYDDVTEHETEMQTHHSSHSHGPIPAKFGHKPPNVTLM